MRKAFSAFRKAQKTTRSFSSTQPPKSSKVFWLGTTLGSLFLAYEILDYTGVGKFVCLWERYQQTSSLNAAVFDELETIIPKYLGEEFLEGEEWNALKKEGQFVKHGNDEACRTPTVGTQTATEETYDRMLHDLKINVEKGDEFYLIIHTPLPTTPLTKGQVDLPIQQDPERMRATILPRPYILEEILKNGGKIIVLYLDGGLEQRPEEGQAFYKSLLKKYPGQLIDMPISKESMAEFPADQIGASAYLLRGKDIKNFFSIGAYQAIKAVEKAVPWSITLGEPSQPKVRQMMRHREKILGVKEMVEYRKKLLLKELSAEDELREFENRLNHSI